MNRTAQTQQTDITNNFPLTSGVMQRKCDCGNKTIGEGECTKCLDKKSNLQRKLSIGASNDPLEREADRVADQVMSRASSTAIGNAPVKIQRLSNSSSGSGEAVTSSVNSVLASSGSPMQKSLRQNMEQGFEHDFSQVRLHTGSAAAQSARDVSARAYTVGKNVVFGAGQFAPNSPKGKHLLAHELTHVVQQMNSSQNKNIVQRQTDENSELQSESPSCSMTAKRETTGSGFCVSGTANVADGTSVKFHYIPGLASCSKGDLEIMQHFGSTTVRSGAFSWNAPTNVSSTIPGVGRLFGAIIGSTICCTRARPGSC